MPDSINPPSEEELVEMECVNYQRCTVICIRPPDTEHPMCEDCQAEFDRNARELKDGAKAKEALFYLARAFGIPERDPWDIVNAVIQQRRY
jgi:hypothetical protein